MDRFLEALRYVPDLSVFFLPFAHHFHGGGTDFFFEGNYCILIGVWKGAGVV